MGAPKTGDHILINIRIPKVPGTSSILWRPKSGLKDMDVPCTFKIMIESQNSDYGCTRDQWPYPNQYQDAKPQSGTSSILQSPKSGFKGHSFFVPSKSIWSAKTWNVDVLKTTDYFQINIRMLNSSQEFSAKSSPFFQYWTLIHTCFGSLSWFCMC